VHFCFHYWTIRFDAVMPLCKHELNLVELLDSFGFFAVAECKWQFLIAYQYINAQQKCTCIFIAHKTPAVTWWVWHCCRLVFLLWRMQLSPTLWTCISPSTGPLNLLQLRRALFFELTRYCSFTLMHLSELYPAGKFCYSWPSKVRMGKASDAGWARVWKMWKM